MKMQLIHSCLFLSFLRFALCQKNICDKETDTLFILYEESEIFANASERCDQRVENGTLAVLNGSQITRTISEFLANVTNIDNGVWIGLSSKNRADEENPPDSFQWVVDGNDVSFFNDTGKFPWAPNAPGGNSCVVIETDGLWVDAPCNTAVDGFLCSRKGCPIADPTSAPTIALDVPTPNPPNAIDDDGRFPWEILAGVGGGFLIIGFLARRYLSEKKEDENQSVVQNAVDNAVADEPPATEVQQEEEEEEERRTNLQMEEGTNFDLSKAELNIPYRTPFQDPSEAGFQTVSMVEQKVEETGDENVTDLFESEILDKKSVIETQVAPAPLTEVPIKPEAKEVEDDDDDFDVIV